MRHPTFFVYVIFPAALVGLMSVVAIGIIAAPQEPGIAIWGPIRPETVRACQAEARGHSVVERMHGALMLGVIGELCPSASSMFAADLVALVQDPDLRVRVRAIEALGAIGPAAKPALDALRAVRGSTHAYVDLVVDAEVHRIEKGAQRTDDAELCSRLQQPAEASESRGVGGCRFRPTQGVE